MPFVRTGKKAERARRKGKHDDDDRALIERAVYAAWYAIGEARLCLPMSALLERVLGGVHPASTFRLRLGALRVAPERGGEGISYDPRGDGGIDHDGFHAWLEDERERLLDPSVLITLKAEGYHVDDDLVLLESSREFVHQGLRFEYEELSELEMFGIDESRPHLDGLLGLALHGIVPPPGTIFLDVRWRTNPT